MGEEANLGVQPLDHKMAASGLTNQDLVAISSEQLNHKQVQRARKGRRLTLRMMQKVCRAFNVAIWHRLTPEEKEQYHEYAHRELFNYAKGYEVSDVEPNEQLLQRIKQGSDGN